MNKRAMTRGVGSLLLVILFGATALSVACSDEPGAAAPDAAADAPVLAEAGVDVVDAGDPDARGAYDPSEVPVVCASTPCAKALVAGGDHFCAQMSDGTVRCWGSDGFGATGTTPVDADGGGGGVHVIAGLTNVTQLSAAGATTCARRDDGSVWCWGDNRRAQLGLSVEPPVADEDPHPTPAAVALGGPAARVDVGHGAACALLSSGALWCWGKDDQRQLARPDDDAGLDPVNPVRGPGPAAIDPLKLARTAGGEFTVIGQSPSGELWTWGAVAGDFGILSGRIGSLSPNPTPNRVSSLGAVTSFAASPLVEIPYEPPPYDPHDPPPPYDPPRPRAHACAIEAGEVYCWGRSYAGALCTGLPDKEQEPRHAPITAKTWPQQLAVGDEITCARMTDGTVYCCGSDLKGRLGTGQVQVLSALFTRALGFGGYAVQVATSNGAVCALVQGGTVECWGSNAHGELGTAPDDAPHATAVKVSF